MPHRIESVRIAGFRSLADVIIEPQPGATVLIGANGSGKSNVIHFFNMMSWMIGSHRLEDFVQRQGGADDQLFGGSRISPRMEAKLIMRTEEGQNDYRFALAYAHPDRFIFTEEAIRFSREGLGTTAPWQYLDGSGTEAKVVEIARSTEPNGFNPKTARSVVHLLRRCAVYQFHDTSDDSRMKKKWDAEDNSYLKSHGGNLAAVLLRLEREDVERFDRICDRIRRILPNFDRFLLEESYGKVLLRWKPRGLDKTIGAHLTSDGSLRFFALVTLLNLPPEMLPDVLLLDEPELGLHPAAAALVGDMIGALAEERQVIVATQSPLLVDAFGLDEILVLELRDGRTTVRRCDENAYREWLEDYTTGELWQKNLLGGRP